MAIHTGKCFRKANMRIIVIMLSLLLASAASVSADGFSARVAAGLLLLEQADNLNGRGHKTINSLNERPASFSRLLPVPLIELRYNWEGNSIFFGSPVDQPPGLSIGYRRKLEKGALTGSVFYSIFSREWQDPYLVGTPRSATDVQTYGGRVSCEDIAGTRLTVALKGTVKRIDNEGLSGDLRRDGALLDLETSWRQQMGGGWSLVPVAGYQRGDYLGDANSFHGGMLGLGANWQSGDLLITSRASGSLNSYDKLHPIFNEVRRDSGYRFSSTAMLQSPFGWRNTFTSAGVVYQWTDSNINFFDTRTAVVHAALGYKF